MTELLEVRDFITIFWFILSGCLTLIFAWVLVIEVRKAGWRARDGNKAIIALLAYFLGGSLVRLSVLLFYTPDAPFPDGTFSWLLLLGGGILAAIGALCAIRVFSPRYGVSLMIGCAALAGAATGCSLLR